jgi:septum formation protein
MPLRLEGSAGTRRPPIELILASTSPYRRALLERLGVPFRTVAPGVDEETWKRAGLAPRELAEQLALAKARRPLQDEHDAVVIGSDQVVVFEDRTLGKPLGADQACAQLAAMAGRRHTLITALAVCSPGQTLTHTDVTTLHMRPVRREEIERYVAADQPYDCAGSYKLEARGIVLFEKIESADHTAITGLPLIALTTFLRELGFVVP